MRLETLELGPAGPAIVFVHGSLNDGITAFQAQRDLSARWRLRIPNRRGYGNSPLTDRVDPDVDAGDIVEILEAGAHLVGTSMGGVIAARAAARAPERVRSLTLIEPPAFPNAIDMPEVATVAQAMKDHWATAERSDATAFMRGFLRALGAGAPAPSTLSPAAEKAAHNLMTEAPWLTAVPAEDVARTSFPKLLVSADWSPAFNAICDRLAEQWNGLRRIFPGAGHAVQRIGEPFNILLERFILGRIESLSNM
jgi:pimeloyl-ACP methyl ester carboxylesterase